MSHELKNIGMITNFLTNQSAKLIFFVVCFFLFFDTFAVDKVWNTTGAFTNWNRAGNWSPNGQPGPGDRAIFNAGTKACVLDISPNVAGIVIDGYTGTINLNGFTLTISGAGFLSTLNSATISNSGGAASITFNNAGDIRFGGSLINVPVTGSATDIYFGYYQITVPVGPKTGSVFNNLVNLTKNTGGINDLGYGGTTFNSSVALTNSSGNRWNLDESLPDVFNGDLTLIINSITAGSPRFGFAGNPASTGNQFNGNITINYNQFPSIYAAVEFGSSPIGGTSTLASGHALNVSVSPGVYDYSDLYLQGFTQAGNEPLTISGLRSLSLGPASTFHGNINFSASKISLNGTIFYGTAYIEQVSGQPTGFGGGQGNNVFHNTTTLVNSGFENLTLGGSSPDIFNGPLTISNTGTGTIYLADNSFGNQFNNNVVVNSTNGAGIYFCGAAGSSAMLEDGKTLTVGLPGFSAGTLSLRRFTKAGTGPQITTLTGTAIIELGPSTVFNGIVNLTAPGIYLNGVTCWGKADFDKTGNTTNESAGGNVFHGETSVTNSSGNLWAFASSTTDAFNNKLTINNNGGGVIEMARGAAMTFGGQVITNNTNGGSVHLGYRAQAVFNGDLLFNQSSGATTIGEKSTGSGILASGRTINIGGSGFSGGTLLFSRFTQSGSATPQVLTLTGTSRLSLGPSSVFDGAVSFTAPDLSLNGTTFNNTADLVLTSAGLCDGGNIFRDTTTLLNSGSGAWIWTMTAADVFDAPVTITNETGSIRMSAGAPITFNDLVTITNKGINIDMAYGAATSFNGNIVFNQTTGSFINIGRSATGSATLASGRTMSIGGTGFSGGDLQLFRFTQFGTTLQSLTLTGNSSLRLGPAVSSGAQTVTFHGDVNFIAPNIELKGATFFGTTYLENNGISFATCGGANIFKGVTTLANKTGIWRLGVDYRDIYENNVTFSNTTGIIEPSFGQRDIYRGDIKVDSPVPVTFYGGVDLNGVGSQSINKTPGFPSPVFQNLYINKTGGALTLNTDITVGLYLEFLNGIVNSSTTNYLNIADDAVIGVGASNASYVDGAVRKTGDDAFTFPVGDNGYYRPVSISAPANPAHHFTARYFQADPGPAIGTNKAATINTISGCEYWTLDRTGGNSNVYVTIGWDAIQCANYNITNLSHVSVLHWNNAGTGIWEDLGGTASGTTTVGTVQTPSPVAIFSPFTLGSTSALSVLPIELLEFTATPYNNTVSLVWSTASELNNDHFIIQHSPDGKEFLPIGRVEGNGTTKTIHSYSFTDTKPLSGKNYYRLAQYDLDGKKQYSPIRYVNIVRRTPLEKTDDKPLQINLYPNPAKDEIKIRSTRFLPKASVVFYDLISGGIVWEKYFDPFAWEQSVDIDSIKPGLYRVFVSSETGKANDKVVVVK